MPAAVNSDLMIDRISDALDGVSLDLVISGSIGAVESVRFIRALRRLSADVTPWLTEGGSQFVTVTALEWAAQNPVRESFSGLHSHVAEKDLLVIAPGSANFIADLAHGRASSPALALALSYRGQGKPILLVPNMHSSMFFNEATQGNIAKLAKDVQLLSPRSEEAKLKFPDPKLLADEVAFRFNRQAMAEVRKPILITMGTTRGYIDDVRYVSNYSSGALGTEITEELHRLGFETHVICGPCEIKPKVSSEFKPIRTTGELAAAVQAADGDAYLGGIFLASVLDYEPSDTISGKIKSGGDLKVSFKPTPKVISLFSGEGRLKIGFKLETELDAAKITDIFSRYQQRYDLSHLVFNCLSDVDASRHRALIVDKHLDTRSDTIMAENPADGSSKWLASKPAIASAIGELFLNRLWELPPRVLT